MGAPVQGRRPASNANDGTFPENQSTSPFPNLPPSNPLRAPLGEVLAMGNQSLVDRTSEQGDAVLADLVAEVLAVRQTAPVCEGRRTSTSKCSQSSASVSGCEAAKASLWVRL